LELKEVSYDPQNQKNYLFKGKKNDDPTKSFSAQLKDSSIIIICFFIIMTIVYT